MENYHVIGLMSGTSLDGLDIAFCRFKKDKDQWSFAILQTECIEYSAGWRQKLEQAENASALELAQLDTDFGRYMAEQVKQFIAQHRIEAQFLASHGHTVFHQPEKKLTFQIGKGAILASELSLPVISDFRSSDVALGGQGAPLVPIGDHHLFSAYDYCLNIGGIANVSYLHGEQRQAWDICPANMVLNALAREKGIPYDADGKLAASGQTDPALLGILNALPYYQRPYPKSLGKEWVKAHVFSLLEQSDLSTEDKLATCAEHIARQIASSVDSDPSKKMIITGGGALNKDLIRRITNLSEIEVIVPDLQTILFKEALIFAFLGVLRWRGEPNCLSSVTGAQRDAVGGCIYSG